VCVCELVFFFQERDENDERLNILFAKPEQKGEIFFHIYIYLIHSIATGPKTPATIITS
jgi:hypothetical protein